MPTRTFTANSGTAWRMTSAFLPIRLTRPSFLAAVAVLLIAVVVYSLLPNTDQSLGLNLVFFVIAIVVLVLLTAVELLLTFRRNYRSGVVTTAAWGQDRVTFAGALGSSTIPYAKIDRVYVRNSAVVLRTAAPRVNIALPSELVDPDAAPVSPGRRSHG